MSLVHEGTFTYVYKLRHFVGTPGNQENIDEVMNVTFVDANAFKIIPLLF